jgi:hypothetical protein
MKLKVQPNYDTHIKGNPLALLQGRKEHQIFYQENCIILLLLRLPKLMWFMTVLLPTWISDLLTKTLKGSAFQKLRALLLNLSNDRSKFLTILGSQECVETPIIQK